MQKQKWNRLTQNQKMESLNERVTVHECDSMENARDIAMLNQNVESLSEYMRELDNRIDALAICLQELVVILKKNKQLTQDQSEMVVGVN